MSRISRILPALSAWTVSCAATGPAATSVNDGRIPTAIEPARLTATADTQAITLLPHIEEERRFEPTRKAQRPSLGAAEPRTVVLPLPPDRRALRRVDVWMTVTRHADGAIADQQHGLFSRYSSGDALRFYLPPLPRGTYDVEVRSLSLLDTVDDTQETTTREREDRATTRFEIQDGAAPAPETEIRVSFHFARGKSTAQDSREWAHTVDKLRTILREHHIVRTQVDCWASSEGKREPNLRLSRDRCAAFEREIWQAQLGANKVLLAVHAHGEDDPPFAEHDAEGEQRRESIRRKNRVAMVRLIAAE